MSSFLSTISCKNCGAIHREDALVLMLTDDATGGDARHADPFSASPTTAPDNDDATGEGVKGGWGEDGLCLIWKIYILAIAHYLLYTHVVCLICQSINQGLFGVGQSYKSSLIFPILKTYKKRKDPSEPFSQKTINQLINQSINWEQGQSYRTLSLWGSKIDNLVENNLFKFWTWMLRWHYEIKLQTRTHPLWWLSGRDPLYDSPLHLGGDSRWKASYDVVFERSSLAIYLTTIILKEKPDTPGKRRWVYLVTKLKSWTNILPLLKRQ